MAKLEGSETLENLVLAFSAESRVHRQYICFARKAELEGHESIARAFGDLASAQIESTTGIVELLPGGELQHALAVASKPAEFVPTVDTTEKNLLAAIDRATHDAKERYPSMAEVARREALLEVAEWLGSRACVEQTHADRLSQLLGTLRSVSKKTRRGATSPALQQDDLLEKAASLAARHPLLKQRRGEIAALLRLRSTLEERAAMSSGSPQHVIGFADLVEAQEHEAELLGAVRRRLWQEPMFRPAEAAKAVGATNRERVRSLRARSELLGLPHGNAFLFPVFQFDLEHRRIHPEAVEINRLLHAAKDPWGVASWWTVPNTWLETRPCDLLGTERAAEVVDAGHALVEHLGPAAELKVKVAKAKAAPHTARNVAAE
jgi:rubrerythrin